MKKLFGLFLLLCAACAFGQNVNFNDTTPAAPSGSVNCHWQKDTSSPANISCYVTVSGTTKVASGTITLSTSAIADSTCVDNTATATGAASTDNVNLTPNADASSITGYTGSSSTLRLNKWITSNTIHIKQCNYSGSSITPGALTFNYIVVH